MRSDQRQFRSCRSKSEFPGASCQGGGRFFACARECSGNAVSAPELGSGRPRAAAHYSQDCRVYLPISHLVADTAPVRAASWGACLSTAVLESCGEAEGIDLAWLRVAQVAGSILLSGASRTVGPLLVGALGFGLSVAGRFDAGRLRRRWGGLFRVWRVSGAVRPRRCSSRAPLLSVGPLARLS